MRYMLLIYNDPTADAGTDPDAMMAEYGAFTQSIIDTKEFTAGDPLHGVEAATSVRVRGGKTTTTDGPFAETKEHLGGYYVVDVKNLDRALEIAAQIPGARTGTIEVRPVVEFG